MLRGVEILAVRNPCLGLVSPLYKFTSKVDIQRQEALTIKKDLIVANI